MTLRFATRGANSGKFFWGCKSYPICTSTIDYIPKYSDFINTKYMGWVVHQKLQELNEIERHILLIDIKGQMLDILRHYLWCRVGACYSSIYRYIILDHLDNDQVLDYFLKSDAIKNGPSPILTSNNGAKIFYDLFYDFMIVRSEKIRNYLQAEFPDYYCSFQNHVLPYQQYNFIDYSTNRLIESDK